METIEILFMVAFAIAGSLFIEYNKLKEKTMIYKSNYINCLKVIQELDPKSAVVLEEVIQKELKKK